MQNKYVRSELGIIEVIRLFRKYERDCKKEAEKEEKRREFPVNMKMAKRDRLRNLCKRMKEWKKK